VLCFVCITREGGESRQHYVGPLPFPISRCNVRTWRSTGCIMFARCTFEVQLNVHGIYLSAGKPAGKPLFRRSFPFGKRTGGEERNRLWTAERNHRRREREGYKRQRELNESARWRLLCIRRKSTLCAQALWDADGGKRLAAGSLNSWIENSGLSLAFCQAFPALSHPNTTTLYC